jgi:hypothetical protein
MLRRGRGVHFFIGVDDVDSFYEQVREHRPEIPGPVDEGWGGRFITLEDPDKYRIFLCELERNCKLKRVMEHQDIANLFRRFKGQTVNVKTTSGGIL